MKKSTRLLAVCASVVLSGSALAQDSAGLKVEASNSEGTVVEEASVDILSKLRFSESGVDVYHGETLAAVFHYSDISKISFRYGNGVGVEAVNAGGKLRLLDNPVAETLELTGFSGEPVQLKVTDLGGSIRAIVKEWNGESVNVADLTPGLYFVTVDKTTLKFIKK